MPRFCLVGLTNTAVSWAVFQAGLRWLEGVPARAGVAQALAFAAGILWSYWWNRRWTFASSAPLGATLGAFVALQLALLAASVVALTLSVDRMSLPATPVWLVTMVLVTGVNFGAQRSLIFRTS